MSRSKTIAANQVIAKGHSRQLTTYRSNNPQAIVLLFLILSPDEVVSLIVPGFQSDSGAHLMTSYKRAS